MELNLLSSYTSTGEKMFAHEEAMTKLRNGKGQPITTHVMLTDVCNHKCAFCSVQHRAGDSLLFEDVIIYVETLQRYGLKSVILSGGGNPILYKCKKTGADFNDVVNEIHKRGIQIGLITNGMVLTEWSGSYNGQLKYRKSWKVVQPSTLDKLTWIRISMSGLDHEENVVYVPDIDSSKTTLGFSYVAHDIYQEPADRKHGKVSRKLDLISGDHDRDSDVPFEMREIQLTREFINYGKKYNPTYIRLLPNCLEPDKIRSRCDALEVIASRVNNQVGRSVAFVQYKPPAAPKACYLGYIHPVLNCDGYVYPCDSCVLNEAAGHSFSNPWRICHWKDIAQIYEQPVRSLIEDPRKTCPGCVFHQSNKILGEVVDGTADITPSVKPPEHINFV